jgi:lipoprotein-anchoring transpeptidase ErfK/SrfK
VKRALLAAVAALAFAAAGVLAAVVPAGSAQSPPTTSATTDTTGATTTSETTTESTTTESTTESTTTTTPPPRPKPKPKPKPKPTPRAVRLAQGVTIGGIHVGGLSPDAAYAVVRASFRAPLVLTIGTHRITVSASSLGAVAYAKAAVARARSAQPGTELPLGVGVRGPAIRAVIASLGRRFDRDPVDSQLFLRDLKPYVTKGEPGKILARKSSFVAIVTALRDNRRTGITLPFRPVAQKVSRSSFGPVVVIHRGSNRLYLYQGMKPWRTFGVATGQAVYPTPLGRFDIVVKWENPWWYPPSSPWAKGAKPIPPGPGNPLGTRWMGLSAPGVGIHGTPDPASIGYSASHGCIRMLIPEAEWMFEHVEIGTPVYIVPQ